MAPNIGVSAVVRNGPGPSFKAGSKENRLGWRSQASLYSKVAPSLFLRTRVHRRPRRCVAPARSTYTRTCLSVIPSYLFLLSRSGNPLRQMLCFKLQAYRIIPRVSEVGEPIRHAQHEQRDGIVSNGDAGRAFFNFDQCRPTYGRARGGDFCRNTAAPARILYIVTELAQRPHDGQGEHV